MHEGHLVVKRLDWNRLDAAAQRAALARPAQSRAEALRSQVQQIIADTLGKAF